MKKRIIPLFLAGCLLSSVPLVASVMPPVAEGAVVARSGEVVSGPGIAVADTAKGKIQGYIHNGIYTYKGVPYATAGRYEEPKPLAAWQGVKMAVTYGAICPQFTDQEHDIFPPHWYWPHWEPLNLPQSDDCQNLNIWTPNLEDGKKRPVMIWLHGGGFSAGSASVEAVYDGESLSRKGDVVVISVNHRLNSLGFLDLSAYGDKYRNSGNLGMLDLVAALQWVHDNIEAFGGDPDNVTIFGQSGGGSKVLTLMTMPGAKGLFHKAVVQSGAVELMGMTYPRQEISRRVAELTLQELGLSAYEIAKLETMPYEKLANVANSAYLKAVEEFGKDRIYEGLGWGPVVDGAVLPADPVGEQGFSELARDIPLLIGTVANEWTTIDQWADMGKYQRDNKNFWSQAEIDRHAKDIYGAKASDVMTEFRKAYPDKPEANGLYIEAHMRTRALKTMNRKADQQGAPVYGYVFGWETPVMGGFGMAYHCGEIPFVFNNIHLSGEATGATKEAYALADKMSQSWINFARSGNPNAKGLPEWPSYTRENGATMIFDNSSVVRYHHDDKLLKLLLPDYDYR